MSGNISVILGSSKTHVPPEISHWWLYNQDEDDKYDSPDTP